MPIPPPPATPSRDDPANFAARGDATLAYLPVFASAANDLLVDITYKHDQIMALATGVAGSLNGVPIGQQVPAAGAFTMLVAGHGNIGLAVFGNAYVSNGSRSTALIAMLPTSTEGTYDHIAIEGVCGGWAGEKRPFRLVASNRAGLVVRYETGGQVGAGIDFWQQEDGSVLIFARSDLDYRTLSYCITSAIGCVTYPSPITVAPTGVLVWSMSTAMPGYVATSDSFIVGSSLLPNLDNVQQNGDPAKRWSVIYAASGTISTSDAREKTSVRTLTASEVACAQSLGKEIGVFKFLYAVAEKGEGARQHVGMTVQRAVEIFNAHGLDAAAYGLICHDVWEDKFVDHPALGDPESGDYLPEWREQTQIAGSRYGFRYDQLALFIAAGLEARISALEAGSVNTGINKDGA